MLVFQTKHSGHSGDFQVSSMAKARNCDSYTCLESSYPVTRVTWPIVNVGARLHVLYMLLHSLKFFFKLLHFDIKAEG